MDTNLTGTGRLIARVSSALGALPIEGATVYIKPYGTNGEGGDLLYTLRTNADGITNTVNLPTPNRSESLTPGSLALPYSEYTMTVRKAGYNIVENVAIPIFDGITSVQSVNLVPLTENDRISGNDRFTTYYENGGYTNLRGNDEAKESGVMR